MGIITRAIRNLTRRKIRTSLVVVALAFSMAIMIAIPAGTMANQQATESMTSSYEDTLDILQQQINKTATLIECRTSTSSRSITGLNIPNLSEASGQLQRALQDILANITQSAVFVNETAISEVQSMEHVVDVMPILDCPSSETVKETLSTPRRSFTLDRPVYTVKGLPLNSSYIENYLILPANIIEGRNLQVGDSGVVVISSNLKEYYGVGVGDQLTVNGTLMAIVGVCESGNQTIQVRTVYMSLQDAQAITGLTGQISGLDVYADYANNVPVIAETIKAGYTEFFVTTNEDRMASYLQSQQIYQNTLDNAEITLAQTQAMAAQEIAIAVGATSLIVLFMMLYTVRERTKEIGTLKAIGFSSSNVMSQFILEGVMVSLIAAVVGMAIGTVAAPFLSSVLLPSVSTGAVLGRLADTVAVTVDPQLMLMAFGASVALGTLGTLYPAWRAAKIRPAEAMRYE
jgi:cell division protein FtsX